MHRNSEGYADPTAGKAIKEADKPPEAVQWIIKTYKDIASLLGYEIVGEIVLRDKKNEAQVEEVISVGEKRLRDMSWEDYGISKNRYKELKAFCLQYDEKKNKIDRGMKAMSYDGMPGGSLSTESPVETQAIKNVLYLRDIRMIEEAAVKANPAIWRYILRSVTQDMPYEYIEYDTEYGKIPMGKTDFNAYRRLFYSFLDKMQIGFKLSTKPC